MRWIGLALLGILVAAAVALAASRLASQQIGLASEPVSAGDALAPKAHEHSVPHRRKHHENPPPASPAGTTPTESTEPAEPPSYTTPTAPTEPGQSDDGEHRGGGGADD